MNPKNLRFSLLLIGLLGVLLCLVSGAARLAGAYTLAGIGAQAIMLAGIALLATAVFGKSFFLDDRST